MDDDAVITLRHHTHWLRLACNHPLSEEFFALLYRLLIHTNSVYFDGPRPGDTSSIACVASDSAHAQSPNAQLYISIILHHLVVLATLASYLFPDGNPAYNMPVTSLPGALRIVPSWEISTAPHHGVPRLPAFVELSEAEREMIRWQPDFQAVVATANRCYHDARKRHGYVLTSMFFVLMLFVPEIQLHIMNELAEEGIEESDRNTLLSYLRHEIDAFCLAPMDYTNAHALWTTAMVAITDTVSSNDFRRQAIAAQTRSVARINDIEQLKAATKSKRDAHRASKAQRRKNSRSAPAAHPVVAPEPADADDEELSDDDDATSIAGVIEFID